MLDKSSMKEESGLTDGRFTGESGLMDKRFKEVSEAMKHTVDLTLNLDAAVKCKIHNMLGPLPPEAVREKSPEEEPTCWIDEISRRQKTVICVLQSILENVKSI